MNQHWQVIRELKLKVEAQKHIIDSLIECIEAIAPETCAQNIANLRAKAAYIHTMGIKELEITLGEVDDAKN